MRKAQFLWWLSLAGCANVVQAYDYPTLDRVDHVLTCMKRNGGQNVDNLWRCSCEIDVIAQHLSQQDFDTARTYQIYKNMPGEKGGIFRDGADAEKAVGKLEQARKDAEKRCFVGAQRQKLAPNEKGTPKPAGTAAKDAASEPTAKPQ